MGFAYSEFQSASNIVLMVLYAVDEFPMMFEETPPV